MYFDLKRFREDHSIRQAELCEVLNVSQGRVSQIEVGRIAVSKEKLNLLTNRYGDSILDYKITIRKDLPEVLQSTSPALPDTTQIIQNQSILIDHFATEIQKLREEKERMSRENDRLTWEIERLNAEIISLRNTEESVDGAARSA